MHMYCESVIIQVTATESMITDDVYMQKDKDTPLVLNY